MIKSLVLLALSHCPANNVKQWDCERHGGFVVHHYEVEYNTFAGQSFGGTFEDVLTCTSARD